jgi:hypothetical protein
MHLNAPDDPGGKDVMRALRDLQQTLPRVTQALKLVSLMLV